MARTPRTVDEAIARFDEYSARLDGHVPAVRARGRRTGRSAASLGRRLANVGMAIGALIAAIIAYGLFVSPIGLGGLFLAAIATLFILVFFSVWSPPEKKEKPFSDEMPNREVVRTLDGFLSRRRDALPAPAARRADAIGQQLPLLESRLAEIDTLDPLAQDARRLMGKHLPELIERYQRVPQAYRSERDGEGLTVDERLVASLDAAHQALDEIGRKLAREDMDAFETQGRFIESRYKEGENIRGQ